MKKLFFAAMCTALFTSCGGGVSTNTKESDNGKYEASWESLSKHQEIPQWLADAKLGIYFHWGIFTVPEYGTEWYPYHMYRENTKINKYHKETYGEDFEYHDFVDMFKAPKFDPKEWAKLFKESGARFAGPCAIHHDGFALWDSKVNPWNSMDKGPKRDITGEMLAALKAEGLKTIATFHHSRTLQRNANKPEHWGTAKNAHGVGYDSHFAYRPDRATSSTDPVLSKLYGNMPADEFYQYWFDEIKEVVDQYSPDMIWFDAWLNVIPEKNRQEMTAYYYNEAKKKGQDVTIGYKQSDLPLEVGIQDIEQGGKKELSERVWMTDITLSNKFGWSYAKGQTYKSAELVIRNMIDVWSKNGVVLLNVSPTAAGEITEEQRVELKKIGEWMKRNAEAIYGTVPFLTYGFGNAIAADGGHGGQSAVVEYTAKDVRFTCSKDMKTVYMFFLGAPKPGSKYPIRTFDSHRYPFSGKVKRVTVLNTDVEVDFKEFNTDFNFTIPNAPMDEIATILKFELE